MDPVTHTLFGLAIGEAVFRPRLGRRAVTVSAWAANLPDIDGLAMLIPDAGAVILRRSFGHSLFLLPAWIVGLSWIFRKKYPDMAWRDLLAVIGVGAAGHMLFDLVNSFGVQLFWPFSTTRPEISIIFIIDLMLTGILAAPHLARLKTEWRPKLTAAARGALACVAIYFVAAFSARARALSILSGEAGGAAFQYAFPEPLGAHRWRGVVKDEAQWRVYLVDSVRGTAEKRLVLPDAGATAPAVAANATPFGRRLSTFFKAPVWTVEPAAGGGTVASVYDLRFTSLTLKRGTPFQYFFDVGPDGGAIPRGTKIW